MAIDKIVTDINRAVADIPDRATVLVGGFGDAGTPFALLEALAARGLKELTVVSNNAGSDGRGIELLLKSGAVRRIVCSYPRSAGAALIDQLHASGDVELELVPQGTLSERIRAGGAGIGGFYTPTGVGTLLSEGREQRVLDDREYVFELPIKGDVALIHAALGDRWGNLTYNKVGRNFAPAMAMAATTTLAEVDEVVPLGALDPEVIVTPGIFISRVVPL